MVAILPGGKVPASGFQGATQEAELLIVSLDTAINLQEFPGVATAANPDRVQFDWLPDSTGGIYNFSENTDGRNGDDGAILLLCILCIFNKDCLRNHLAALLR